MPEGPAVAATSVALVEDDRATRERLACSVRAQSSLELVAEYRNGAEALAGLASRAPDVLLVDLGLPDMSGLELIRFAAERYAPAVSAATLEREHQALAGAPALTRRSAG